MCFSAFLVDNKNIVLKKHLQKGREQRQARVEFTWEMLRYWGMFKFLDIYIISLFNFLSCKIQQQEIHSIPITYRKNSDSLICGFLFGDPHFTNTHPMLLLSARPSQMESDKNPHYSLNIWYSSYAFMSLRFSAPAIVLFFLQNAV